MSPTTLAVLIGAISGAGGHVVTDTLQVDVDGSTTVPMAVGAQLPIAIVAALRILETNYAQCDSGDVFAYTKGIHFVLSVVGYTDEGGYVRDVVLKPVYQHPQPATKHPSRYC